MTEAGPVNSSITDFVLRGEIKNLVYESEDADYSVFKVIDPRGVEHTVVGHAPGASSGQSVEITGIWEKHPEYGRQLRLKDCKFVLPSSEEGIIRYLSSGILPGVGPKRASCIVERFGIKTLDILDNYSARLNEVPGLGKKTIEGISSAWQAQSERRELYIYMQGLGISHAYCRRIYKVYGESAAVIVKENPYKLADDVDGIGFQLADRIARKQGIGENNIERLRAGVIYALNKLSQQGHCCYPKKDFLVHAAEVLRVEDSAVDRGIVAAVERKQLIIEEDIGAQIMLYDSRLYKLENELPHHLRALAAGNRHRGERMQNIRLNTNINLSENQLYAVERAADTSLSIITGGPGVGKTTVVGEIVRRAVAAKLKVFLAAPTGRAAKRLSESSTFAARTIHRMLKYDPGVGGFVYGRKNQLKCDLLIVDEVSMLDLPLAVYLFRAVRAGTTVVLVGDCDQLPSVGPGRILRDFMSCGLFATTKLTEIFRQGAGSSIIRSAHAVNHGQMPEIERKDKQLSDFYFLEQDDPEKVNELIVRMASERIPQRFGFHPTRDIQVLAPMNRGSCGTVNLNVLLQEKLNTYKGGRFGPEGRVFRAGDKVMQTVNNYDKNVFNGDMGRILSVSKPDGSFIVRYDDQDVQYDFSEADQISLAYATTVHKAQGSEFPAVIVPLLNQHYMMLQRNLLYTAMTRAQKLLILIGSKKAVQMAVNNIRIKPRHSLLLERIRAAAIN